MNPEQIGRVLFMLPVLLVVIPTLLVLIFLTLATVRAAGRSHRQKQARRLAELAQTDVEGKLLPPLGRGVCQCCQQASETVYYLADGRRLCSLCYRKFFPPPAIDGQAGPVADSPSV